MHLKPPKPPSFAILKQLRPGWNRSGRQSCAVFTQPGPITDLRRDRRQRRTLSLSLKGFDALGDRNPALRTLHPDEVAWSEPGCVIKSSGFEGEHVRYVRNMIDADSALGTEHTRILV